MRKKTLLLLLSAAILALFACGDDETNPAGTGLPPTPSVLWASVNGNDVTLSWSVCQNPDFADYTVFRSAVPGIAQNPSGATIVAVISNSGTTEAVDQGLPWGSGWFYAVRTTNTGSLVAWSNEVPASVPDSGSGGGGGGGEILTCYQVQGQAGSSPYEGMMVSVTGIVTVGSKEYYSPGSSQYAVIQDQGGGEWSGLVIFGYDGVLDDLTRGDSVVIHGKVQEYYGLTELTNPEVLVRSPGHSVPQPRSITTGDLSQEKWEGVLCRLNDVEVTNPDLGYGEFAVDDGSGACVVDDLGIYGFTVSQGQKFASMVGVVWYSFGNFKLEPRNLEDITE